MFIFTEILTLTVPSYHEVDYIQMHPVPLDAGDGLMHMSSFSNLSISDLTE